MIGNSFFEPQEQYRKKIRKFQPLFLILSTLTLSEQKQHFETNVKAENVAGLTFCGQFQLFCQRMGRR
jgi:hypothetical protein